MSGQSVTVRGTSFNPHRPRRAGATRRFVQVTTPQLERFNPHRPRRAGATRFHLRRRDTSPSGSFNPHRPRRAGATVWFARWRDAEGHGFNPHRPRRAGATGITARCEHTTKVSFNPHRPRRAGATIRSWLEYLDEVPAFQSSPAPKSRCNFHRLTNRVREIVDKVSILTGPEEPVQHSQEGGIYARTVAFQSSPAPKSRCNARLRRSDVAHCR